MDWEGAKKKTAYGQKTNENSLVLSNDEKNDIFVDEILGWARRFLTVIKKKINDLHPGR